jgi:hypothetical protein
MFSASLNATILKVGQAVMDVIDEMTWENKLG